MASSGYDKYLEFLFDYTGSFYKFLFRAIGQADQINLAKLQQGFPEEVDAYKTYTRIGKEEFKAKCTPSHHLLHRLNDL